MILCLCVRLCVTQGDIMKNDELNIDDLLLDDLIIEDEKLEDFLIDESEKLEEAIRREEAKMSEAEGENDFTAEDVIPESFEEFNIEEQAIELEEIDTKEQAMELEEIDAKKQVVESEEIDIEEKESIESEESGIEEKESIESKKSDIEEKESIESEESNTDEKDEISEEIADAEKAEESEEIADAEKTEESEELDDTREKDFEEELVLEEESNEDKVLDSEADVDVGDFSEELIQDMNLEDDADFEFIEPLVKPNRDLEPVEIKLPPKKKLKISPKFFKVVGVIVASLVVIYVIGIIYFSTHYFANTVIAGRNYSFKSYKKVAADLDQRAMTFDINLVGREDTSFVVNSSDVDAVTTYDKTKLFSTKDGIHGLFWIENCYYGMNLEIPASVVVDEEKLTNIIAASNLCDKSLTKKPGDAYVKDCYSTTGQFEVVDGYAGTELIADKAAVAVNDALQNVMSNDKLVNVELDNYDCYEHSVVTTDNIKLNSIKDKANKFLEANITINWNGEEITLTGEDIRYWLDINGNEVTLNENDVRAYVLRQDDRYLTYGKTMSFVTHSGKRRNIKRRDYGWQIDIDVETAKLINAINSGRTQTLELEYTHEAREVGVNDIGNSYVEIDLGNQHMYLYKEGKMILDSDFVSGNERLNHHTPDGIDAITYKSQNATLRGPGYASFVYYWMPFNGGIGLHDATWRSSFGGDIYKTDGSHGCVNLPLEVAKELYQNIEKDYPVVCYW